MFVGMLVLGLHCVCVQFKCWSQFGCCCVCGCGHGCGCYVVLGVVVGAPN